MRVCSYKGIDFAVLSRDEHCPPHVHVGDKSWVVRFEFSFWNNNVTLMESSGKGKAPKTALLNELRKFFSSDKNLKKARSVWMEFVKTACLENKHWDLDAETLCQNKGLARRVKNSNCVLIEKFHYDPVKNKSVFTFEDNEKDFEIELS